MTRLWSPWLYPKLIATFHKKKRYEIEHSYLFNKKDHSTLWRLNYVSYKSIKITKWVHHHLFALGGLPSSLILFGSTIFACLYEMTCLTCGWENIHISWFSNQGGYVELHDFAFPFFLVLLQGLIYCLRSSKIWMYREWFIVEVVKLQDEMSWGCYNIKGYCEGLFEDTL